MGAKAFADTIIGKLKATIGQDGMGYGSGVANTAMQAVADAVTEYLTENTTVMVGYTGTIASTPPAPDPTVNDTFRVTGKCAPTGMCADFETWIKQLEANIIAGIQLAPAGNAGVVFAAKPWVTAGITTTRGDLKGLHEGNADAPQQPVWTKVCQDIMDWAMGAGVNVTPGSATHPAAPSTGVATITKITVK